MYIVFLRPNAIYCIINRLQYKVNLYTIGKAKSSCDVVLLYRGGLELNPQCLGGMPVFSLSSVQCQVSVIGE